MKTATPNRDIKIALASLHLDWQEVATRADIEFPKFQREMRKRELTPAKKKKVWRAIESLIRTEKL